MKSYYNTLKSIVCNKNIYNSGNFKIPNTLDVASCQNFLCIHFSNSTQVFHASLCESKVMVMLANNGVFKMKITLGYILE